MNEMLTRRKRICQIRETERKIAEARLVAANRNARQIEATDARILSLRAALSGSSALSDGQQLQNRALMEARLDRARDDLAHPREEAWRQCEFQAELHRLAIRGRDGADKLFDKARRSELHERELREDADRPRPRRAGRAFQIAERG
jgi:hypothetical protein